MVDGCLVSRFGVRFGCDGVGCVLGFGGVLVV